MNPENAKFQRIIYRGRMAALVVGGQAIISEALPGREQTIVKPMCLYVAGGRRTAFPRPYSDAQALASARAAAAKRS